MNFSFYLKVRKLGLKDLIDLYVEAGLKDLIDLLLEPGLNGFD
jgi:hypothetical protein